MPRLQRSKPRATCNWLQSKGIGRRALKLFPETVSQVTRFGGPVGPDYAHKAGSADTPGNLCSERTQHQYAQAAVARLVAPNPVT